MQDILLGARVLERFRVIASELMTLNLQLSHQQVRSWWWLWWWWERELAFGSTWDAFGLRRASESEQLPRVFVKQQCLLHHQSTKFNCHLQDLTLF